MGFRDRPWERVQSSTRVLVIATNRPRACDGRERLGMRSLSWSTLAPPIVVMVAVVPVGTVVLVPADVSSYVLVVVVVMTDAGRRGAPRTPGRPSSPAGRADSYPRGTTA